LSLTSTAPRTLARKKFEDPDWTASGEPRATVSLDGLQTLWINTGTLCNITCRNCYIESSPSNDRLIYLTAAEVQPFLQEADALGTREIGFTGGEPFLNPDILDMLADGLARGFEVLVLTNAMLPMQRPRLKLGLVQLNETYKGKLTLRVSLDHYTRALHETERGPRTWEITLQGIDWLSARGFQIAIAGRTCWGEDEVAARAGYAALIKEHGWRIEPNDAAQLMLFPEMDGTDDVPEITTRCWDILNKSPSEVMCSSTRMIVKRKGAAAPVVLPCTLLPYDTAFEMGTTLAAAAEANGGMFTNGAVKLCHSHCAKFCVLGGGSCS
jgi:hypothetical protein